MKNSSSMRHKSKRQQCISCEYGFTLIELMIVVAVVAVLAAIALPSYNNYVKKSRVKSAGGDLAALSLNFENYFQRKLAYPESTANSTTAVKTLMAGWAASQADYFTYSVNSSATEYTLTATGTGAMDGCTLTLTSANARTVSPSGGSACGGVTAW